MSEQKRFTETAEERHESILKVVSSTLTTNVGKLLEQTVRLSIEKSILPSITTIVKKSVDQQLAKALGGPLDKSVTKEMRSSVLEGLQKVLLESDNGIKLADSIGKTVKTKVEQSFRQELPSLVTSTFETSIIPMLSKMEERLQISVENSVQRVQKETSASQQDLSKKIDKLAEIVSKLTTQLQSAAPAESGLGESSVSKKGEDTVQQHRRQITEQFGLGKFSAGIEIVSPFDDILMGQWSDLPDDEQAELFDICIEYDPSIFNKLDQLSLMSAASIISIDLKSNPETRLTWLEKIVSLAKREVNIPLSLLLIC